MLLLDLQILLNSAHLFVIVLLKAPKMKSQLVMVVLALFLVIVGIASAANGALKTQDLSPKKVSSSKKGSDVEGEHVRFEDWGDEESESTAYDWSKAEMLQHPIDEAPRRVSSELVTLVHITDSFLN